MTIEELAAQMNTQFADVNEKFADVNEKFAGVNEKFAGIEHRFDELTKRVGEGFDASRARDEELRDLAKFGLEARDILREEMHRRFDDTDRKHDDSIELLQTAVRDLSRRQ
jgi:septation ring formation regulator EzrA